MNLSGTAVAKVARKHEIPPDQILVIYDELDLPLGRLRLRHGGSSGGNRGIESLLAELGTDRFRRLRVGIDGPHRSDAVDYVLSPFAPDEHDLLALTLAEADAALKTTLRAGFTRAMNHYNSIDLRIPPAADTDAPPDKPEHEESDP
jgi:PTH1 family peptidyl-tRNA hydrolase